MASNLTEFFRERFIEATGKWNNGEREHEESLEELSVLLMEPRLPLLYRLKANLALAIGQYDWYLAEDFRHDAEKVYGQIRMLRQHPSEIERELIAIRERLDTLAEDQVIDDPRTEVEAQDVGNSQELPGDSQEPPRDSQEPYADADADADADSQDLQSSSQELPGGSQELPAVQESSQLSEAGYSTTA
jgi:hypothetical protein